MATEDEVATALTAVGGQVPVALFHCVSAYPADIDDANLRAIVSMRERFNVPVGWSDHTVGSTSALVAVALGAAMLEKHVTTDPTRPGPDHAASASPEEFANYVAQVRSAERSLGDGVKRPSERELPNRDVVRRSWHARADLSPGDVLTPADVAPLRPASGISASVDVTGRVVRKRVAAGQAIRKEDLV
jgi:N-acetylneuraminate synthase/N,N'-diacetyllegionaminate synthase